MRYQKFSSIIARLRRSFVVFLHDIAIIPIAWLGALWLRFNLSTIPTENFHAALFALPFVMIIQGVMYHAFGLYRGVWRFSSMQDLLRIIKAVLAGVLLTAISLFLYNRLAHIPRSLFPMYTMLLIMSLGGARFVFRWQKDYGRLLKGKRVLIVGAGQSGESLVRDMLRADNESYLPVGFVDDEADSKGKEIHGVRVLGKADQLPSVVAKYSIDLVMIALPSASSAHMRGIVDLCEQAEVAYRTLPSLNDLTSGRVSIEALRQVSLEDLLGRDPVELDWQAIGETLTNKRVVVTGGAGSIGSELCRQIARLKPEKLAIIDANEFGLYTLQQQLIRDFPDVNCEFYLVDVTDAIAVKHILAPGVFDALFHAAAYKHVPMLESQLRVAVRNNLLGTWTVANAAVLANIEKFVLISTDKAVHPANIMGATKRGAEIICQNLNSHCKTQFITVRFGNVLGSTGSVVPLFKDQIARGGPITVTDPEITRFFMTIPEATALILQASVLGQGGEIFVLDMGEPVKIRFLAEQMIRLAGLEPERDIAIDYIGLRPGEKLYEELFHQNENLAATSHEKIMKANYRRRDWGELQELLNMTETACKSNDLAMIWALITKLVPDFVSEVGVDKTGTILVE